MLGRGVRPRDRQDRRRGRARGDPRRRDSGRAPAGRGGLRARCRRRLRRGLRPRPAVRLAAERAVAYANAAGAIVASRLMCADAMPTAERDRALDGERPMSAHRRRVPRAHRRPRARPGPHRRRPRRPPASATLDPRRDAVHRRRRPHRPRAMVGLGDDPLAMADRRSMLDRLLTALAHPRVDGVLASPDIMEDLVLLGALEDRVAVGTMNRGGLAGATWELDDRFTAYDTEHLVAANLDAGKMLLRIDGERSGDGADPRRVRPRRRRAQRPPHDGDGRADPLHQGRRRAGPCGTTTRCSWCKAVGVCAALGGSSAYTWLKIQATADIATVAAVTTQPLLLLGGAPGPDPAATFAAVGAPPSPSRPSAGSQRAALDHLDRPTYYDRADSMILDAVTVRNLEMTEPLFAADAGALQQATLLAALDQSLTGMGGRLLRNRLLRPSMNREEIEQRLDALGELLQQTILRAELRKQLGGILDVERLLAKVTLGSAGPRDVLALGRSLEKIPGLKRCFDTQQAARLRSSARAARRVAGRDESDPGGDRGRAAAESHRRRDDSRRVSSGARRAARLEPERAAVHRADRGARAAADGDRVAEGPVQQRLRLLHRDHARPTSISRRRITSASRRSPTRSASRRRS